MHINSCGEIVQKAVKKGIGKLQYRKMLEIWIQQKEN